MAALLAMLRASNEMGEEHVLLQVPIADSHIESGKSQLLEGHRSFPSEGVVYGYGAGTCAKHSS